MTNLQKIIHYLALACAVFLIVSLIGGLLSAVGLITAFVKPEKRLESAQSYEITDSVRELELDVGAARLTVKSGDSLLVESNLPNLQVEVKNGCLYILQREKHLVNQTNGHVTLYLPQAQSFDEVDFTTGAGDVHVDTLCTRELDMELGAGQLTIRNLIVTGSGDIEGGAGEVSILDGELRNVDISMGVGSLELTARMTGSCKLDCGVGSVELTLLGDLSQYRIEVQKGLGRATVDGDSVANRETFGTGDDWVKINGGVGEIEVKLK